jgi:hypothetical protein
MIMPREDDAKDGRLRYDRSSHNDSGHASVSAFSQVVKLAKLTTLVSLGLTILAAVALAGMQIVTWKRTGEWEAYRVSSVLDSLKGNEPEVYTTASIHQELSLEQAVTEWVLALPATAPLLVVAALLAAFYWYLSLVESRVTGR